MTTNEMADAMLKRIGTYGSVTFVELRRLFGQEAKGQLSIVLAEYPNIVLWTGVSKTFVDAFDFIRSKIRLKSTSELTYLIDGGILQMPIAKKKCDYKEPHWAPVCLNLGPGDQRLFELTFDREEWARDVVPR